MRKNGLEQDVFFGGVKDFMPSFSIDCVIFGFHSKKLKVLLNKFENSDKWMIPGGFVLKTEDVDDAALRVLTERTGLKNVFLKQFHVFGKVDRIKLDENKRNLEMFSIHDPEIEAWYLQRFISLGYYALVKHSEAKTVCLHAEEVAWFGIDEIPPLYADHNEIIQKAIATIRKEIGLLPIGYQLLPQKFTMPELRNIYEAIIGTPIDRRNFQRKILSTGLVVPLNETRKSGAHKSPNLYAFVKEKYEEAEKYGLQLASAAL